MLKISDAIEVVASQRVWHFRYICNSISALLMTSIAILMGRDWNKAEVQTMESWIESWTTSSLLSSIGLGTNFSIVF